MQPKQVYEHKIIVYMTSDKNKNSNKDERSSFKKKKDKPTWSALGKIMSSSFIYQHTLNTFVLSKIQLLQK